MYNVTRTRLQLKHKAPLAALRSRLRYVSDISSCPLFRLDGGIVSPVIQGTNVTFPPAEKDLAQREIVHNNRHMPIKEGVLVIRDLSRP